MERLAFPPLAQLCATSYCKMLGVLQTGALKNQRRNSRVILAGSPRNPFLNHKGKGVATVVICADLGEDEEERPALPAAAITTLEKSSKFKNLFDQLGLTVNE